MSLNFQKPENALKRAEELVSVGQKAEALNVLHTTVCHRKLRSQGWDPTAELLMLRHVRLCVELEKFKFVREGLHFYRYVTQQHNIPSLQKAMKELRDLSEKKLDLVKVQIEKKTEADDAKKEAEKGAQIASAEAASRAVGSAEGSTPDTATTTNSEGHHATATDAVLAKTKIDEVEDLEADETPESLMLSMVHGDVRDKAAKDLHTALLGCWESYKIILDLLRYAPKLDQFYHETAQKALRFCFINKRYQEFRRLCDTLRTHYAYFQRQRNRPELEAFCRPENHLSTRLCQLDVAAELGLWSQCFVTAEDIAALGLHDLLQKALTERDSAVHRHRGLLLAQTSVFYDKLAMIFKVSHDLVFHAAAVLRNLFHTRQHKKTVSKEEQTRLCDLGTLAVLCVPILPSGEDLTPSDLEFKRKLAGMLGHSAFPTRPSMKNALESQGLTHMASPGVQRLYRLLEEQDINPLTLCKDVMDCLIEISPALMEQYGKLLKKVVLHRLMIKLGQIYRSISIPFFTSHLCPEDFLSWKEIEIAIVEFVQQGGVQLRFDYCREAILFGSATASPDFVLRNRLVEIARVLSEVVPQMGLSTYKSPAMATRDEFYTNFDVKLRAESDRLRSRNQMVADRRKKQEDEEKEKADLRRTLEKERQKKEQLEEQGRREAALRHQEDIRRREEQKQLKLQYGDSIVAEFKSIAEKSNMKIMIKGKSVDEITAEDVCSRVITYEDYEQVQEEVRHRERHERGRLRKLETKRVEHLVRALREAEAPLLREFKVHTAEMDAETMAEAQEKIEAERRKVWEDQQAMRQVFLDVQPFVHSWLDENLQKKGEVWEKCKKERLERIREILKQKKIERARVRRREAEERMRREEEERQREAEERERLAAEAARKEEERLKAEALQRAAEKQRQKELEIEQRQRRDRERGPERGGFESRAPDRGERVPERDRGVTAAANDLDWGSVRRSLRQTASAAPVPVAASATGASYPPARQRETRGPVAPTLVDESDWRRPATTAEKPREEVEDRRRPRQWGNPPNRAETAGPQHQDSQSRRPEPRPRTSAVEQARPSAQQPPRAGTAQGRQGPAAVAPSSAAVSTTAVDTPTQAPPVIATPGPDPDGFTTVPSRRRQKQR